MNNKLSICIINNILFKYRHILEESDNEDEASQDEEL